jgi:hypothetical protein
MAEALHAPANSSNYLCKTMCLPTAPLLPVSTQDLGTSRFKRSSLQIMRSCAPRKEAFSSVQVMA